MLSYFNCFSGFLYFNYYFKSFDKDWLDLNFKKRKVGFFLSFTDCIFRMSHIRWQIISYITIILIYIYQILIYETLLIYTFCSLFWMMFIHPHWLIISKHFWYFPHQIIDVSASYSILCSGDFGLAYEESIPFVISLSNLLILSFKFKKILYSTNT